MLHKVTEGWPRSLYEIWQVTTQAWYGKVKGAASQCAWLLLAAPGCSWLLLVAPGAPGCSWSLLAVPGCSWLLLAAPGCSWLLLAAPADFHKIVTFNFLF